MNDAAAAVEDPGSPGAGPARAIELAALVLLVGGFVGGLSWSSAVGAAMPGWFDPSESCEMRFGAGNAHARLSMFPVEASCVYADDPLVREFIPRDEASRLTAFGVGWMLASLLGLGLFAGAFVLRLRSAPAPEGRRSRWARLAHLASAGLLGALGVPLGWGLALFGIFSAGPLGMLAGLGTLVVAMAIVATALDLLVGPYRRDPLGPRWRGMALGGLSLVPSLIMAPMQGGGELFLAVAWMGVSALLFSLVVLAGWTAPVAEPPAGGPRIG